MARGSTHTIHKQEVIPILHWEEIEGVLEGVGYVFTNYSISKHIPGGNLYTIWITKEANHVSKGIGKSRQEAVMGAVIKLGEEIK